MLNKAQLVRAINDRIKKGSYTSWHIGITNEPDERKNEHTSEGKDTRRWQQWRAATLKDARDTIDYFVNEKGMKGSGTGSAEEGLVYVYIF